MKHYTCKCGACEFFGSGMLPDPCGGCTKCGTIPGGADIKPHILINTDVEVDDGLMSLHRCKFCYKTKKQIEELGEVYTFKN